MDPGWKAFWGGVGIGPSYAGRRGSGGPVGGATVLPASSSSPYLPCPSASEPVSEEITVSKASFLLLREVLYVGYGQPSTSPESLSESLSPS